MYRQKKHTKTPVPNMARSKKQSSISRKNRTTNTKYNQAIKETISKGRNAERSEG
jgi:hypothetical protein